jgi:hypothetical protein
MRVEGVIMSCVEHLPNEPSVTVFGDWRSGITSTGTEDVSEA